MQARQITTNFTAGELSPRLRGRVDLSRYGNGAAEVMNLLVQPHGGVTRRPGSYYVGAARDQIAANTVIVRPFVVSTIAAYVLVFSDYKVEFIRNRGFVLASGVHLSLNTPWPQSVLRQLRFAQSADVLYVTHPDYQPRKITRVAADQFAIAGVTFQDGPYLPENQGAPGFSSGSTTTSSAGSGTSEPAPSGSSDPTLPADAGSSGGDGGADGGGADGGGGGDGGSGE